MNALEIKDLTKNFKDFSLGPLSLTLPRGCIMGLIGENGAGKTTTLKLLLGSLRADSGSITIFGQENAAKNRSVKEDIGIVMDEVGFPECLNIRELGKIFRSSYRQWDEGAWQDCLRRFAIPADKPFGKFSRGMKMKTGIAVALSHHAKLLLLDEAANGLDPVARDEFLDILNDFTRNEECSVLISSHIVSDLEKICDYIAFLHQGKLMLCEEKDVLREEYGIIHCSGRELLSFAPGAVLGTKSSPYGAEALVRRDALPAGMETAPANIEDLFIYMVKGES